jgi:adenylylsulfate kinase-like enzyme
LAACPETYVAAAAETVPKQHMIKIVALVSTCVKIQASMRQNSGEQRFQKFYVQKRFLGFKFCFSFVQSIPFT